MEMEFGKMYGMVGKGGEISNRRKEERNRGRVETAEKIKGKQRRENRRDSRKIAKKPKEENETPRLWVQDPRADGWSI